MEMIWWNEWFTGENGLVGEGLSRDTSMEVQEQLMDDF